MQILYSYLRYTDRPLNVFSLLLAVILLEFHENPRRKDWVAEKRYIEEFVWGISLFWLHALLLRSFLSIFSSTASFLSTPTLYRKKNFAPENGGGGGGGVGGCELASIQPPSVCDPDIYQIGCTLIYNKHRFIVDLYWIIKNMWIISCKYTLQILVFEATCFIFLVIWFVVNPFLIFNI